MIGWPTFQTKDGKLYGRVWAPGPEPHRAAPDRGDPAIRRSRRAPPACRRCCTARRPAARPPAPQTEYILVSAIEAEGQAWVEVDAGIDINPAALQLPGVPLARLNGAQAWNTTADRLPPPFWARSAGLPMLLAQFGLVLGLLIVGILIYMAVTPFRERELMRDGNTAAATVLGGALVALAIPLAALLATTGALLDILVWGVVAVILQLVTV